MAASLLKIDQLHVNVEEKEILQDIINTVQGVTK